MHVHRDYIHGPTPWSSSPSQLEATRSTICTVGVTTGAVQPRGETGGCDTNLIGVFLSTYPLHTTSTHTLGQWQCTGTRLGRGEILI